MNAPTPIRYGDVTAMPVRREFSREELMALAFPVCDAGIKPLGSRVLVQIRTPARQTAGGIFLADDSKDTEKWNTQVGKIIACGDLAFRNRQTQTEWPEGAWVKPGQFARVPKYGGDRWEVPFGPTEDQRALFAIFNDLDIIGLVTGDPLAVKAYI